MIPGLFEYISEKVYKYILQTYFLFLKILSGLWITMADV